MRTPILGYDQLIQQKLLEFKDRDKMKIFKTVCMVFLSVLILSTILGVNSCVDNNGTVIKTQAELENAFNKGGTYIIAKDITVNKTLTVKNGNYVQLKCTDSYGSHTITSTFDPEWTNDPAISVEKGATLKLGLGSATLNLSIPHDIILNIGTLYVYEYAFLHGSYNVIENYGELEMDGGKIKLTRQDKGYTIEFAEKALKPVDTIVELEMAGNAMEIQPMEITAQSLSYNKKVTASSNPNPNWHGISSINNGDWSGHFWMPSQEDKTPWAEIDLGKTEKISKAILYESGQSVKSYELQYLSGDQWKTGYTGTTIGSKSEITFPPFSAQKVRLVLKGFEKVPGIYEIVLL